MDVRRQSVICSGCGCLCDDLDLTIVDDRIVEVANVCLWGVSRFLTTKRFHPKKERRRLFEPQVRLKGRGETVTYETALEQAGAILARARRPLIYGLTNCGSWAQEAALRLARARRGRLEPADLSFRAPYYRSLTRHGLYWAPLDVIRDAADTILYWGANPIHSSPRHVVRHSVFARGRFTERGVEDRRVAAVDLYRTETAKFCQLFVAIEPGQELALLQGMIARLTGGAKMEPPIRGTRRLSDFLAQADYGVIFCGRGVGYGPAPEMFDQLARLIAVLNEKRPFTLFPLSGDFNAAGLHHLLVRELGSPGAPDFGGDHGVVSHFQPVDFRQVDAVLVAGADLFWFLGEEQAQDLKRRQVPIIVLSPFANRTTAKAQVVLPVALTGVEANEVAYRMDGLPVVLKEVVPGALPPDHQVLADLAKFT